ncbi:Tartrate-resistant acid phosphatase type 5 precursor [Labilithrix luteola]|uniref:Tartrate-resistant acid phosphatase type 5 n=1 Tax=Labilithrix luteola TaxID=1391654 RepID=A0A0K1PKS7_9BACT|nr:Tartrate-resistant acid phosphatase type 5 precursor [Labilithrix luteola]
MKAALGLGSSICGGALFLGAMIAGCSSSPSTAQTSDASADAGTTGMTDDAGTTGPDADAGTTGPDADAGTTGPDADAGTTGPDADAGTVCGDAPGTTLDYTAKGFDFLLDGDWGNQQDLTDMQKVAAAMNTWAAAQGTNFVISLGSNFYQGGTFAYEGVQSATDAKFTTLWKDVYAGTTLSQVPWWLVLGNHDWYATGSPKFEMQHQDPNWNLPDYFYTKRVALPGCKHATFVFVETNLLFYGYAGKQNMATNFASASWSLSAKTHLKQLAWIDWTLQQANQDEFVIVIGDHPTFTCGSDVTGSAYMGQLGAILTKWQPTAYVNAHHSTLAYYAISSQMLQVQVGSGGNVDAACAPVDPSKAGQQVANTYGFAHAKLSGTSFALDFVTEANSVAMQTSVGARTPVVGVTADTAYLPPPGDPSIHAQ